MHTLMLFRHAKSDWKTPYAHDFGRSLNRRGRKAAGKMAAWISANDVVPDRIVSSAAARAQETADILVGRFQHAGPRDQVSQPVVDARIYEADLATLLAVIADQNECRGRLMLVGHNPGLEALLFYLCSNVPSPSANGKWLPTAGLAVLRGPGEFPQLAAGAYAECTIIRPRELE